MTGVIPLSGLPLAPDVPPSVARGFAEIPGRLGFPISLASTQLNDALSEQLLLLPVRRPFALVESWIVPVISAG